MKLEIKHLGKNEILNVVPFNRQYKKNPGLEESLRKNGFIEQLKVVKTSYFGSTGLYIIDGMHRYNLGLLLNLEIPYTIVAETDKIEDIVGLMAVYNNTQRKWVLDNYVECYANTGNSSYIFLRNRKTQSKLTYSSLAIIYSGGSSKSEELRNGSYKIPNSDKGDLLLSYIIDLKKLKKMPERASVQGFVKFYNSVKNYNHMKFINNLSLSLPIMNDCLETAQFASKFNEIYYKK